MLTSSNCIMPELSNVTPPLSAQLVLVKLGGFGPKLSTKGSRYKSNYPRLVDKAIYEYQEARGVLLSEMAENNLSPDELMKHGQHIYTYAYINHFENCINSLSRLFKLFERIKGEESFPEVPRKIRRYAETKSKSVFSIRNVVEHIDKEILEDKIGENPSVLYFNKDRNGIKISTFELKSSELAKCLEAMFEIGLYLLSDEEITV